MLHVYVLKFVSGWLGLENDGVPFCPLVFHVAPIDGMIYVLQIRQTDLAGKNTKGVTYIA